MGYLSILSDRRRERLYKDYDDDDGRRRAGVNWASYWATLISATVETATPTHVVLTFPTAQTSLGASDFTIAGFTISSASWTGAVLTLVLSTPVLIFHGDLVITFIKISQATTITNNVADDGNTVVWYDASDVATLTKDVNNYVSKIADKLGSGNDLLQSTEGLKPKYIDNSLLFDGENDWMVKAFTFIQPCIIYLLIKQVTHTVTDVILFSYNYSGVQLTQSEATPRISFYAGTSTLSNTYLTIGDYGIVRLLLNGENSKIQVNNTPAIMGNAGTNNPNGITLASNKIGEANSNIQVKEIICRKVADSDEFQNNIYQYLVTKGNVDVPLKLVTIGDSITKQVLYQPVLVNDHNLIWSSTETTAGIVYRAMAVSSSRVVPLINDLLAGQQLNNSIYERVDDADNYWPDIIILMGGQNDLSATLGTMADAAYEGVAVTENAPSFYSAYKGILKKLTEQNPNVRIICLSPFFGTDALPSVKQPFVTAILECAAAYNCEGIDLLNNLGINADNQATYLSDGVHLTDEGGVLLGNYLSAIL